MGKLRDLLNKEDFYLLIPAMVEAIEELQRKNSMLCANCKEERVQWMGPLSQLTHTECLCCGTRTPDILIDDQVWEFVDDVAPYYRIKED